MVFFSGQSNFLIKKRDWGCDGLASAFARPHRQTRWNSRSARYVSLVSHVCSVGQSTIMFILCCHRRSKMTMIYVSQKLTNLMLTLANYVQLPRWVSGLSPLLRLRYRIPNHVHISPVVPYVMVTWDPVTRTNLASWNPVSLEIRAWTRSKKLGRGNEENIRRELTY